jgi:hypothetical protein
MANLQIIGGAAVVIGLALEIFRIGSSISLGTSIAAVGIIVFVYAFFRKREQRNRDQ